MGSVLADHADRNDQSVQRSGSCRRQARLRCDDADEKDRHRQNRSGAPRLRQSAHEAAADIVVAIWEYSTAQCLMAISHDAMIGPRGPRRPGCGGGAFAGGGPNSGVKTYATWVLALIVIVRAPCIVGTVARTAYLSGESSCTTVTLPPRPSGM